MGVFFSRWSMRPALIATLLAAGSAQASSCLSIGGNYDGCNFSEFPVVEIVRPPFGGMEVVWPTPLLVTLEPPRHDRRHSAHDYHGAERRWTYADAISFVHDQQRRHPRFDFDEFRRQWIGDHHHDRGDCDDDLPRPVPLPGAVLLFGPALLMLRAFQRRNG